MRSNPVPGILIPGVRFLADKGKNPRLIMMKTMMVVADQ